MKTKLFVVVVFIMMAHISSAQSDNYQHYLDKALEKLDSCDCESAQRNYHVYKELSGNILPELEQNIENCFEKVKSSEHSKFLNMAMEKLEAGDCESAQKYYDIYKELSGESKSSVQTLIDDCKKKTKKGSQYILRIKK